MRVSHDPFSVFDNVVPLADDRRDLLHCRNAKCPPPIILIKSVRFVRMNLYGRGAVVMRVDLYRTCVGRVRLISDNVN